MEGLNVLERNIKIDHLVDELSKEVNLDDLKKYSRQMQRKRQKHMDWFRALSKDKKDFLDEVSQSKFQSKLKEDRNYIIRLLDMSITAALIQTTEYSLEDIQKIGVQVGMNFGECVNFDKNFGEEGMKKLADIELEVRAFLTEIIKTEKDKAKCIRLAKDKFRGTGITTVHLANAYKTVKEAIDGAKAITDKLEVTLTDEAKELEDKINYIFEEDKKGKKDMKTKKTKAVKKEVEAIEEAVITQEPVEEVAPEEIKEEKQDDLNLKVVNEVVIRDIQGRFGVYHIEKGIVTLEDKVFIDKDSASEIFSKEREELIDKLNTLNLQEKELIAVMDNFR